MDYFREMPLDDPQILVEFREIIREIVRDEIKKAQFNRKLPAKVVNVGTGVADIQLLDSSNTITSVKVRDGLSLTVGDEVYVEFINGSSSNIFIDIKK